MYKILHHIHTEKKQTKAGVIHIPVSHEMAINQGEIPSWSQHDLQKAIEIIIHSLE